MKGSLNATLRDLQYIAKKAKTMLFDITRQLLQPSGSITDRLRKIGDW